MLENHHSSSTIGDMVLAKETKNTLQDNSFYYQKYGIEYVMKNIYAGSVPREVVSKAMVPMLLQGLYYLPQSYIVNREIFNYEFDLLHKPLLQGLEQISEFIFIDIQTSNNISTKDVLEEADIIVVNIPHEPEKMEQCFSSMTLSFDNLFFLVSNYQKNTQWNLRRILDKYNVSKDRMGVVPYNMELEFAGYQGRVLQFINQNSHNAWEGENAYFIRKLRGTTKLLQNMIREKRR